MNIINFQNIAKYLQEKFIMHNAKAARPNSLHIIQNNYYKLKNVQDANIYKKLIDSITF